MPNCKDHTNCDLVCPWDGYYCHTQAHEWRWQHVSRQVSKREPPPENDMPDDPEAHRNEKAEERP